MARKRASAAAARACPRCGYVTDPAGGAVNFCPACGASLTGDAGAPHSGRAPAKGGALASPARADAASLIDDVIADRYRLIELVGEGGMGSVYKAEHIRMGKALALKVLRGDFAREPGAVDRFLAEARIVSRLSHPHTIGVFDFGEIGRGEGFYLAMEYVPGQDLARVLREKGPLGEARAADIGQQVLGALAEAHDAGIVHRDMKPGNVMLMQTRTGEDFAKVLDFGIAKLRDDAAGERGRALLGAAVTTSAGAIVGTPNYLAPEQARGGAVDARSDLYALGCVLFELVAGRPPFVAPNPMAVVSAHLSQEAPPLASLVPAVSRRFAEVVGRALAKRPEDRFDSADAMRDALLAIAEPTGTHALRRAATPDVTGDLQIASREDFDALDRKVRVLRPSRVGPVLLLLLAATLGAGAWRWGEVYALLVARAPRVAARVPAALRPSGVYDGFEHEPNDAPAQANPLPLPPGPDGRIAGGAAVVRGHVGARLDDRTGDVDIFRIDVPPAAGKGKLLVATWHGERDGEGIRGLDVVLTLNRAPPPHDPRGEAPLVAAANHGGSGAPERLAALVEPGRYYLAVREQHDEATGPVEKPTDEYVLEVRLADPVPGEEIEPDDAPEAVPGRPQRYPAWRALAERNPLVPGAPLRGETSVDDPDTLAVARSPEGGAPALVAVVPAPSLALEARLWTPDAADLAEGAEDRVRFEAAAESALGAVLIMPLRAPEADAPALVSLRGTEGGGAYTALAVGKDAASGSAVLGLVRSLAAEGRASAALDLAAAYAGRVPDGAARAEVLLEGGKLAEAIAGTLGPAGTGAQERAAQLLGDALFEAGPDGRPRYRAAFEKRSAGEGRLAEEAALRVAALAAPCTPADVAGRAAGFLARVPAPAADLAAAARRLRARAAEEAFFAAGGADAILREAALAAWRQVAAEAGPDAEGARARIAAIEARPPVRGGSAPVCP